MVPEVCVFRLPPARSVVWTVQGQWGCTWIDKGRLTMLNKKACHCCGRDFLMQEADKLKPQYLECRKNVIDGYAEMDAKKKETNDQVLDLRIAVRNLDELATIEYQLEVYESEFKKNWANNKVRCPVWNLGHKLMPIKHPMPDECRYPLEQTVSKGL
jgi:hypothetical protein